MIQDEKVGGLRHCKKGGGLVKGDPGGAALAVEGPLDLVALFVGQAGPVFVRAHDDDVMGD
jgi:hypothetical protein